MLRIFKLIVVAVFAMFIGTAHAIEAAPTTPTPEFTVTTTSDTSEFGFYISAAGTFTVDWGDGAVEPITKPDTTNTWYSHTYDTAKSYTIGISGDATAYDTDAWTGAIRFYEYSGGHQAKIAGISGSLGKIFGDLSDGTGPRFNETFRGCTSLTSIPGDLFAGITSGAENMFSSTFQDCTSLTSIPGELFAGITSGSGGMFFGTFVNCRSLTSIPGELFASITTGAGSMFSGTFLGCKSLTTIPGDLFAGIKGPGASYMFEYTFSGCTSLTSIPGDLFSGITSGGNYMFYETFAYCSSLTGYVNGNMFTVSADGYSYTFYGANKMDTVCPENTYAVPKPDSTWTVAVCLPCPTNSTSPANSPDISSCVCNSGYAPDRNGGCTELCDVAIRVGDGLSVPMYKAPMADQSIIIPCGGEDCYISVYPDATIPNKYYIHAER